MQHPVCSDLEESQMIGHILVPLDGSKLAEVVLPYAKELGTRLNARITFLQVIRYGMPADALEGVTAATIEAMEEETEREVQAASDYLSRLAGDWQAEGIDARWQVARVIRLPRGTPAPKIIDLAHSLGADLIAMSTHGRSGLGRVFFGSVADEVLREAGTPVLLIRSGHRTAETPHASE